jgi:hypothetical protein
MKTFLFVWNPEKWDWTTLDHQNDLVVCHAKKRPCILKKLKENER